MTATAKGVCNQVRSVRRLISTEDGNVLEGCVAMQAEQKRRSKARKESQKPASRFEEEPKKGNLLNKYDEEEEEAAMLIGEQGKRVV